MALYGSDLRNPIGVVHFLNDSPPPWDPDYHLGDEVTVALYFSNSKQRSGRSFSFKSFRRHLLSSQNAVSSFSFLFGQRQGSPLLFSIWNSTTFFQSSFLMTPTCTSLLRHSKQLLRVVSSYRLLHAGDKNMVPQATRLLWNRPYSLTNSLTTCYMLGAKVSPLLPPLPQLPTVS